LEAEVILKILRREAVDADAVMPLLADARSRLLAFRLNVLEKHLKRLNLLINPPVFPFKHSLSEDEVAQLQKSYYTAKRNQITMELGKLVQCFIEICDALLTADPIVEATVELSKNLQATYKTLITLIEKVTDSLANLADVARDPDEVLKAMGSLQTEWTNLLLTTQHIIITPLKTAIIEEARNELIGRIGHGFLGR